MIPPDHPRYRSLVLRERIADAAREGAVVYEGIAAHGRGEAFDYLIGEKTTKSAEKAAWTAAAFLHLARYPVISVNGNTAALAAEEIAALADVTGAKVEVNLFHRTKERMEKIEGLLTHVGVDVLSGKAERLLPLSHERALCLREGIFSADVVLVPLEDGDRCAALIEMGKTVITIDLNPLSRTARTATVTIVDELTRALPMITKAYPLLDENASLALIARHDNRAFLDDALQIMKERLDDALD